MDFKQEETLGGLIRELMIHLQHGEDPRVIYHYDKDDPERAAGPFAPMLIDEWLRIIAILHCAGKMFEGRDGILEDDCFALADKMTEAVVSLRNGEKMS